MITKSNRMAGLFATCKRVWTIPERSRHARIVLLAMAWAVVSTSIAHAGTGNGFGSPFGQTIGLWKGSKGGPARRFSISAADGHVVDWMVEYKTRNYRIHHTATGSIRIQGPAQCETIELRRSPKQKRSRRDVLFEKHADEWKVEFRSPVETPLRLCDEHDALLILADRDLLGVGPVGPRPAVPKCLSGIEFCEDGYVRTGMTMKIGGIRYKCPSGLKVCERGYIPTKTTMRNGRIGHICARAPDLLKTCEARHQSRVEAWEERLSRRSRVEACVGLLDVGHGAIEITSLSGDVWSRVDFEDFEDRDWSQIVFGSAPALAIDVLILPLQVTELLVFGILR